MSYPPPPPATAGPSGKPRLRGRIPLRLAIIFLVLGVAGMVVGGIIAVNGALKKVDDFTRIDVPSSSANQQKVHLGTGGYIAYYESSKASTSSIPPVPVAYQGSTGEPVRLTVPYGGKAGGSTVKSLSYDYNGHKGVALWQFTITKAGTYTVAVGATPGADADARIAIGRSIGKSTAVGAALIIIGVLLFVAGLVLLIVGLVKRSRHKKQLASAGAYGYPPPPGYGPGGPGYPPPPGYGPPAEGHAPPPGGYAPPPQQGWAPPSGP